MSWPTPTQLRSLCLHPSAGTPRNHRRAGRQSLTGDARAAGARATGTFNGTLGTSSEAHVSGLQFDSQARVTRELPGTLPLMTPALLPRARCWPAASRTAECMSSTSSACASVTTQVAKGASLRSSRCCAWPAGGPWTRCAGACSIKTRYVDCRLLVAALTSHPALRAKVGTVSPADGELHLFDLGVCDSTPTEVLAGEAVRDIR